MQKWFFLPLFTIFTACAYNWGAAGRQLPGGHKKIYIKMFENRDEEIGIESDVTNAFIQELTRSGVGEISDKKDADVILEGVIHTVDHLGRTSVNAQSSNLPFWSEYQTNLSIIVRVKDKKDQKELWQGQFLGERNYKAPQITKKTLVTANPLYNLSARRQVIQELAQDLAREAIASMTENF